MLVPAQNIHKLTDVSAVVSVTVAESESAEVGSHLWGSYAVAPLL